ncbi:hypothetical protein ABIC65_003370 [Sphingomonas trueperi]
MPAKVEGSYKTLGEWAIERADMRIVCECGRTINVPADKILSRFGRDSSVQQAVIRLRCSTCRRRGMPPFLPFRC